MEAFILINAPLGKVKLWVGAQRKRFVVIHRAHYSKNVQDRAVSLPPANIAATALTHGRSGPILRPDSE